jgi:hypothetical protein
MSVVITLFFVILLATAALAQIPSNGFFLPLVYQIDPTATPTVTPTVTQTPLFTFTPAPTATQTPIPTQRPPGVYVDNHTSFTENGELHIVGEVFNSTGGDLEFVTVQAELFNNGQPVGTTDPTELFLSNLPDGEESCFHVVVENPPALTSYQFLPPTSAPGEAFTGLTLFGDSGSYTSNTQIYGLTGNVRNDYEAAIDIVEAIATLYNASGSVLGCGSVNVGDLDPGDTAFFAFTFNGTRYADVFRYEIDFDGDPQDPEGGDE